MAAVSLWPYSDESFFFILRFKKNLRIFLNCFFIRGVAAKRCIYSMGSLLVKMCLERPAGRDKHENIK